MNFNADLARITSLQFTRKIPADGSSIHVKELAIVKATAKVYAQEKWPVAEKEYEWIKQNREQIKSVEIDTSDRGPIFLVIDNTIRVTAFPKSLKIVHKHEKDGTEVFVFNFVFEKELNEAEDTTILALINLKEPNDQGKMIPKQFPISTENVRGR